MGRKPGKVLSSAADGSRPMTAYRPDTIAGRVSVANIPMHASMLKEDILAFNVTADYTHN